MPSHRKALREIVDIIGIEPTDSLAVSTNVVAFVCEIPDGQSDKA